MVQRIFVIVSVLCIPVMLFVKPIVLFYQHKKKSALGSRLRNIPESSHVNLSINGEDSDEKYAKGHSSNVIQVEEEDEHEEKVGLLLNSTFLFDVFEF